MSNQQIKGAQRPDSATSDYNAQSFLIAQELAKVRTATLVKVTAVTTAGEVGDVGFVDVFPMVNQVDGSGQAMPHAVIHNVPYFRLQGGANAVIIDPQIGDIGICVFSDRDISAVKTSRTQASPRGRLLFSMSDGLYLGGVLNGTPTQYVQFSAAGIVIHSPNEVKLSAPSVVIIADSVAITSGSFTHNGVNVGSTHVHGGISPGGSNTSGPA